MKKHFIGMDSMNVDGIFGERMYLKHKSNGKGTGQVLPPAGTGTTVLEPVAAAEVPIVDEEVVATTNQPPADAPAEPEVESPAEENAEEEVNEGAEGESNDEPEDEPEEGGDTDKESEDEPDALSAMEALIANMPDGPDKEKMLALAAKTRLDHKRDIEKAKEPNKGASEFKEKAKTELLPKAIEIAKAVGFDLKGKKITLSFPTETGKEAEVFMNGSKKSYTPWLPEGKQAELRKLDGTKVFYKSPSAMASELGIQVANKSGCSHKDVVDCFEHPQKVKTYERMKRQYKVDAVKGDHFIVTILQNPIPWEEKQS